MGLNVVSDLTSNKVKQSDLSVGRKTKSFTNLAITRNRHASASNQGHNPYNAQTFKEQDLLYATNAYHKLDKMGNINQNKAFAQTIFNDMVQKDRQSQYQSRLKLPSNTSMPASLLLSKRSNRSVQKSCYPLSTN
jgi:hypothetical protein